jgi:hypothetical protein
VPERACAHFGTRRAAIGTNPENRENEKENTTPGAMLDCITIQSALVGFANAMNTHVHFPYTLTPPAQRTIEWLFSTLGSIHL